MGRNSITSANGCIRSIPLPEGVTGESTQETRSHSLKCSSKKYRP
jgi:hypothetical protein